MSLTTPETDAVTRLGQYNGDKYDASTNPYGLGGEGYRKNPDTGFPGNWDNTTSDMSLVAAAVAREAADAVAAAATATAGGVITTSASSNSVGTGTKTFVTAAALQFQPGQIVQIADTAAPTTNYMTGVVSAWNSGTKTLEVVVPTGWTLGSGTKTAWNISFGGPKGDTGATGIGFTRDILTATGSANAFVLTPGTALGAYADQQVFIFEANHTITGAATVNISGLGAKAVRKNFDEPLEANDIKPNQLVMIVYEASTHRFQRSSPIGQMLTNPELRGWNRQIVYRSTVANTTADQIAIVFDTATRLHNLRHKLFSGPCTITLKKNGTAINFGASPSTNVNVTTTQTTVAVNHASLAYIDFAAGDRLDISITSASSADTLTVGLDTTENVS